jgi:hypothetical protein
LFATLKIWPISTIVSIYRACSLSLTASIHEGKEVGLYNLKGWIMARWSVAAKAKDEERPLMSDWDWTQKFSNYCGSTFVETTFQVFLALKLFPGAITLGSAALLQSISRQFIEALRSLYKTMELLYQVSFFLAAFAEAANLEPVVRPILDKEDAEPIIYKPMQGPTGDWGMASLVSVVAVYS